MVLQRENQASLLATRAEKFSTLEHRKKAIEIYALTPGSRNKKKRKAAIQFFISPLTIITFFMVFHYLISRVLHGEIFCFFRCTVED